MCVTHCTGRPFSLVKCLRVRPEPTQVLSENIRLRRPARYKHSRLQQTFIIYRRTKFYYIGPQVLHANLRLRRPARHKHSSLQQTFINYGRGKCYNIGLVLIGCLFKLYFVDLFRLNTASMASIWKRTLSASTRTTTSGWSAPELTCPGWPCTLAACQGFLRRRTTQAWAGAWTSTGTATLGLIPLKGVRLQVSMLYNFLFFATK